MPHIEINADKLMETKAISPLFMYWIKMDRDGTVRDCYTLMEIERRKDNFWFVPDRKRGVYIMNGRCMAGNNDEARLRADRERLKKIDGRSWPGKLKEKDQ